MNIKSTAQAMREKRGMDVAPSKEFTREFKKTKAKHDDDHDGADNNGLHSTGNLLSEASIVLPATDLICDPKYFEGEEVHFLTE